MAEASMFSNFADRITAMQVDPDIHAYATRQQRLDQASFTCTYQNGRAYQSARYANKLRLSIPLAGTLKRAVRFVREAGELGDNYR